MAQSFALPVRQAVIMLLGNSSAVTEIVPASSINPSTVGANPAFPFLQYGSPTITPLLATGLDSCSIRGVIHGFAKPIYNGDGAMIETAEDVAQRIDAAVTAVLGNAVLMIDGGMRARFSWVSSNISADTFEAGASHSRTAFRAEISG